MQNIISYEYKGQSITFDWGNVKMVNATEMAKPFGKKPSQFLRLPSTKRYCKRLEENSEVQKSHITIKGKFSSGKKEGSWFHRKLAIRFAQWLDIDFAIWVDGIIEELLIKGTVSIMPTYQEALRGWADEMDRNKIAEQKIKALEPLAEFTERLRKNNKRLSFMREVAKVLDFQGIGGTKLFTILREKEILMTAKGRKNEPYQKYINRGLFKLVVTEENGLHFRTTKVTKEGIYFIYNLLAPEYRTELRLLN